LRHLLRLHLLLLHRLLRHLLWHLLTLRHLRHLRLGHLWHRLWLRCLHWLVRHRIRRRHRARRSRSTRSGAGLTADKVPCVFADPAPLNGLLEPFVGNRSTDLIVFLIEVI